MEILGYIGYIVLIFFASTWTMGVRIKLDLALPTALGALFFTSATVLLWVFEVDKIHSWWVLPSGFAFSMFCLFILSARVPVLSDLIKFIGSLYMGLIRIGISQEKVKHAQYVSNMQNIEKWASKKKFGKE